MKWVAIALLASTPAYAETLVDSIKRHDDIAVSRLRSKLPDASARCALGVVYIFRDDLTRAAHYLEGCATARIAPEIAGWVRLAVPRLDDRLFMSELAALEVTTEPAGLLVTVDTVPDELFDTPAILWLPAGRHELRAGGTTVAVTLRPRGEAAARLDVGRMEHPPQVDPRVAVMRENDCTLQRRRTGTTLCTLSFHDDDDDLDAALVRRIQEQRRFHARRYDPRMMILQSAEEL